MPRSDSDGDRLVQGEPCFQLPHGAWWAREESNPQSQGRRGYGPGQIPLCSTPEMDSERVALSFPVCDAGVLLLDDEPVADARGVAPRPSPLQGDAQTAYARRPFNGSCAPGSRPTGADSWELNADRCALVALCAFLLPCAGLDASGGLEPPSRRSERRVLPLDDKAVAVPTGAAPVPPARQAGVQTCYTMAPQAGQELHPRLRTWKPA